MICTYTYRSVNSLGMLMNNIYIHYYCIKSRIYSLQVLLFCTNNSKALKKGKNHCGLVNY